MSVKRKNDISGNELGFGNKATVNNQRMLKRDGKSNIRRKGLSFFRTSDTYNALITMSWSKFMLIILLAYLLINTLFAWFYVSIGIQNLAGAESTNKTDQFFDAFFFSAQTISTVGYGHISPRGMITSSLAAFESMLGLLAFALATGLLYGRFSRPSAKIKYSENMIIAPFQDGKSLMFRLANYRSTQLVEIEAQVLLAINEDSAGKVIRRFFPLELERKKINLLTLSWTIVHPIDEKSPINGLTAEDLDKGDAEFIVMLKAFDDTFSQTVHSRTSYQYEEVVWDAKFKPVIETDETGILTLDMSKINDFELINN
jgi:inward rectifier potassium channel